MPEEHKESPQEQLTETHQRIRECWNATREVFEELSRDELSGEASSYFKKETAFSLLEDEFKIPKNQIRREYHAFIINKKCYGNSPSRVYFSGLLLWLRSRSIWFVNISTRWIVLGGAVAAFFPVLGFFNEQVESNRLQREQILQARRNAVKGSLETLKALQVDISGLEARNAIELLAAEGRSLDDMDLSRKSLGLLDVSPQNLSAIRSSYQAPKSQNFLENLIYLLGFHSNWESFFVNQVNEDSSDIKCKKRLEVENSYSPISEDILCVSMERVKFQGAQLQNTNFSEAILLKADFSKPEGMSYGADLTFANLTNTNLISANFENAILEHAKFQNANLNRANFKDAKINGADFSKIELDPGNYDYFTDQIIQAQGEVVFAVFDSELRNTQALCGKAVFPVEIIVQAPEFKGWGFEPADKDFEREDFKNYISINNIADFSCYTFAKFTDKQFSEESFFDKVQFPTGSNFNKSNLTSVNFNSAIFKESTFVKSLLTHTTFDNTEFIDVDFSDANLSRADFGSSKFVGSIMSSQQTNWTFANLSGITLQDKEGNLFIGEQAEKLWQIVSTGKNWHLAVYSDEIRKNDFFLWEDCVSCT